MSTVVIVSILIGACLGGFVSGIAGFAFGLVSLAFWVWWIEPQFLAPMVVFGSLVAQMLSINTVLHKFDLKRVLPFVIGGALGVPVGVSLLGVVNVHMFRLSVGIILIVYCSSMLLIANAKPVTAGGRLADGVAGAIGGAMGGLAGLTGPAPTLWCTIRGWDKDTQRCVFQIFNIAMQVIAMTMYWAHGVLTPALGRVFGLMLPTIIIPALVGARLYRRINERVFRRIVLALLLLSGVVLLVSTLSKH